MKQLIAIIKFICFHPLTRQQKLSAFIRFLNYQIQKRLKAVPVIHEFTDRVKLIIEPGMTGATGNLYCGLHEFEDMSFLLHLLRKEDLFVDVGANIGSYTLLASGHIGCKTIAFEPIPTTYQRLNNNIKLNHLEPLVRTFQKGIGSEKTRVSFTATLDTINHVVTDDSVSQCVEVEIDTLDALLNSECPVLIKIDVEGYETLVIKGAEKTLQNPSLIAIIIELNGSGAKYGFGDECIHQSLNDYGFQPCIYDAFQRKIVTRETFGTHNTIYVRSIEVVMDRLTQAEPVKILNRIF